MCPSKGLATTVTGDTASNDGERRAYWARQMDLAFQFMQEAAGYPVSECGEPLVFLREAVDAAGVEVLFSDSKMVDDLDRLFLLRAGLAVPMMDAARKMNQRGWVMKVEDGFRTREMQKRSALKPVIFDAILRRIRWECGGQLPDAEFVFRRLSALLAYCPKVGTHTSGSAIDISVLDRQTGQEIGRGRPYLETSELTPMESPFVEPAARRHRAEITALMRSCGFMAYPFEFWHYSQGDVYDELLNKTGKPARYGAVDWDPATRRVTPIGNPTDRLNSREDIELAVAESAARMGVKRQG
jgi:D-alanyl-D-alanine dipeptidase